MCSEAGVVVKRGAGVGSGLKESLRNHPSAQANADMNSETAIRHLSKSELHEDKPHNLQKEICCAD